jgi:hypothetical protein
MARYLSRKRERRGRKETGIRVSYTHEGGGRKGGREEGRERERERESEKRKKKRR